MEDLVETGNHQQNENLNLIYLVRSEQASGWVSKLSALGFWYSNIRGKDPQDQISFKLQIMNNS